MTMAWADPLRPAFRDDASGYTVGVVDNERQLVATVRIDTYGRGRRRLAWCRTLRVQSDGAPRQKVRALVLLMRAALQHAAQLGIVYGRAEATPQMLALAKKITGHAPEAEYTNANTIFAGRILDWWQHAKEASDSDGNVS